jgi:hypothetical protein
MPASSISGALSTSVYFIAMFLLLGMLVPPIRAAYQDSDLAAAGHLAEGTAEQIDDLSPGMTSVLEFGSFPGVTTSVVLSGDAVTATVGGASASAPVVCLLPGSVLSADVAYTVVLEGGDLRLA